MSSHFYVNKPKKLCLRFPLNIIYLFIILSINGVAAQNGSTKVGAIIDVNSRIGKELKAAMEIAAEDFNNHSDSGKLILHFRDSGRNPLVAASAAEELIKEQKVQVIIGMETWQEAVLVADHVGNHSQVIPVISFAAPPITPPLIQRRWPFLIRMASSGSAQMKCIADMVTAYNWKRVVVIYEDDGYGGDVGLLALLSEALQDGGAKIEHHLVLPRVLSSMSNPNWTELEELLKLPTFQSRVFIVLQSSLPTVTNLFRVAKKMGLVGRESAWIITESISSLLDPQDNYDMEGTLGIKTYYANKSSAYDNFQKEFQAKYSEEKNSKPGIYALRAYDTITIISQAIERMPSNTTSTGLQGLLNTLLSNYKGLSGNMRLKEGEALVDSPRFRIVNVVDGKMDEELNYWTPEVGFSESLIGANRNDGDGKQVIWPGNLKRAPKGWAMPTTEKPMIIGVPGKTSFSKFVSVEYKDKPYENTYDGFCIQIFYKVLRRLNYSLPYEFHADNATYPQLVEKVHNKTYDALVGDITVLAERMDLVDFTQPYMGSGLTMIVPQVSDEQATWMFMKPFTWQMWVVTSTILVYTMLIIWFLERPTNPDFGGPLKDQIFTAIWFTFSSLFFAHREKVYSNLTRVVFIVWLFVVLILTSSYTASLSSMLTVQRLQPNVTDIEMLRRTNAPVGLDGDSFVYKYMEEVLQFKLKNLVKVASEYNYTGEFKNKRILAAFLELPYAEVFMNKYCEGYTATTPIYRFGGLSFVFQKGSPLAKDFSKAILELLENGEIKKLQKEWLTPEEECSKNSTSNQSLSLNSFAGLYVISGATSTFCFLLSLAIWLRRFQLQETNGGNASPSNENIWNKTVRIVKFFKLRDLEIPSRAPTFASYVGDWTTPRWGKYSPTSNNPEQPPVFRPLEIECIPVEQTETRV
ncbi:hypothetical protein M0R45_013324 [Rubus argutus]|uniref:Glutamate receptor n=1 Tax=Rubus argutus TaxID=59490 RepID=A0AAW1XJF7_RUBAR